MVKNLLANAGDTGLSPGLGTSWASLVDQLVKNPPAMRETWVQSLGWDDPLEKGKATDSSPVTSLHFTGKILYAKGQLNLCAQLLSPCSRAWGMQLLSPSAATTEVCPNRTHTLQQEKPL